LSRPDTDNAKACADAALQPIRRAEGEPLFAEPWEAQALALAVALQQAGAFTANEWADALGAAIKRAQAAGDPDDGSTYYRHVLAALEQLVHDKGIAGFDILAARKADWVAAYERTPHGKPVELT
jgi:nitrile hydratase accessory protein